MSNIPQPPTTHTQPPPVTPGVPPVPPGPPQAYGPPYATPPAPSGAPSPWQTAMNRSMQVVASGGKQSLQFVTLHGRRVFSRTFEVCQPTPAESPRLDQAQVENPAVRQYLLWRRSLLLLVAIPGGISAVLHVIDIIASGFAVFNFLGVLVSLVYAASFVAVPVSAVLAALHWSEQKRSRRILTVGWLCAFLVPMLIALIPINWTIDWDGVIAQAAQQHNVRISDVTEEQRGQIRTAGALVLRVMAGGHFLMLLLPAVLSLIPGTLRACTRIKTLLPQSIVPGWFLVIAAPLYSLILLLLFVVVNQLAGNLLLILGLLLLVGAPAIYLAYHTLFIHPLTSGEDRRRLDWVQFLNLVVGACGAVLIVIYLFTAEILPGKPLIGENSPLNITVGSAIWDGVQFWINYLSKSLFITAVATDLFMMVTVSVWRNMRKFEATPEGEHYEGMMSHLYKVVFPHPELANATPITPPPVPPVDVATEEPQRRL